jgi:hypothetical protein
MNIKLRKLFEFVTVKWEMKHIAIWKREICSRIFVGSAVEWKFVWECVMFLDEGTIFCDEFKGDGAQRKMIRDIQMTNKNLTIFLLFSNH